MIMSQVRSIFPCKERISKAAFYCSRKDKTFFTYGQGADISFPPYPNGIKLKSNLPTEIWVVLRLDTTSGGNVARLTFS